MKRTTMKLATFLAAISAGAGLASATSAVEKRGPPDAFCGPWDGRDVPPYSVANDLWGSGYGVGRQCTSVARVEPASQRTPHPSVAWSTTWNWQDAQNQVKSYANAVVNLGANAKKLSDIKAIDTHWEWSYNYGKGAIADVAYDIYTADVCPGAGANAQAKAHYEVMIWLANHGSASPLGSRHETNVKIAGLEWNVFRGFNPASHEDVISFVPTSPHDITTFTADLKPFFLHLTQQGMASTQCLYQIGAGTEAFVGGESTFKTNAYYVVVS